MFRSAMMISNKHAVAGGPTIYLKDTFTDANGTLLTAHTPEVGNWLSSSYADIQNNQYVTNYQHAKVTGDTGGVARRITFDSVLIASQLRVHSRYIDSNNYVQIRFLSNLIFRDHKVAGVGEFVYLGSFDFSTPVTVMVEDDGNTVNVYRNGALSGSYSFGTILPAATQQMIESGSAGTILDNVQIEAF